MVDDAFRQRAAADCPVATAPETEAAADGRYPIQPKYSATRRRVRHLRLYLQHGPMLYLLRRGLAPPRREPGAFESDVSASGEPENILLRNLAGELKLIGSGKRLRLECLEVLAGTFAQALRAGIDYRATLGGTALRLKTNHTLVIVKEGQGDAVTKTHMASPRASPDGRVVFVWRKYKSHLARAKTKHTLIRRAADVNDWGWPLGRDDVQRERK